MAEEGTAATPDASSADSAAEAGGNYTPPATQADLDRIIADRVKRTKAQFQDYNDLKAAKAELDQIKAANQTEAERQAQETTRWQTEAETWRGQAVGARIEALAADMFADSTDAVDALKDKNYLDAGGQIDSAAITADLNAVLERKPHWRRQSGAPTPRPPAPNLSQGSGGGNSATTPAAEFAAILGRQLGGAG